MSKRNTAPSFLPCVATHYRNVLKTMLARVGDVREGMEERHGYLAPECMLEIEQLGEQCRRALIALDARSSKPEFTNPAPEAD